MGIVSFPFGGSRCTLCYCAVGFFQKVDLWYLVQRYRYDIRVLSLFFLAGYNNTPYYPSAVDMQSSLTIYNSSSSLFTLEVMSVVSLVLPVVAGYIFFAWRAMDRKAITADEMKDDDHIY